MTWITLVVSTLLLFTSHPFEAVAGHETYPYLATTLLGVTLVAKRLKYRLAGCILGVATAFRPDAILMTVILLALDLARSGGSPRAYLRQQSTQDFMRAYGLFMTLWLSFLLIHFGRPIPGTMLAKRAQVMLGHWPIYSPATIANAITHETNASLFYFILVGMAGFGALLSGVRIMEWLSRPERFQGLAWIMHGCLLIMAYTLFKVTFWYWYAIPVLFSLWVPSIIGLVNTVKPPHSLPGILKDNNARLRLAFFWKGMLLVFFGALLVKDSARISYWFKSEHADAHIHAYSEAVSYIKKDSPGGAVILMPEPGSFGYHLGPKYIVVDELGLISPGVAQALIDKNYSWALNKWKPKYIICSWDGLYSACHHDLQKDAYELVGEYDRDFWMPQIHRGAQLYRQKKVKG